MTDDTNNLLVPTTSIVTAFMSNNSVNGAEMPRLIAGVHQAKRVRG